MKFHPGLQFVFDSRHKMTNVIASREEGVLHLGKVANSCVLVRLMSVLAWLLVLVCECPAHAWATSPKDVKIGIHVIDFVINTPPGRNAVGIVYDSRSKESSDDAQLILEYLSSSVPRTMSAVRPVLVDIRELDDVTGLRAVFVADRMKPFFDQLAEYGRHSKTLVLSSDLDCVRAGKCTVGIASSPRVEVIVSSQQAQASGIQFSEAFRMMVTEY